MNFVSIGLNNGSSSVRPQAIIQTNAGLLSIGPLRTFVSEILSTKPFIHENVSENIVC